MVSIPFRAYAVFQATKNTRTGEDWVVVEPETASVHSLVSFNRKVCKGSGCPKSTTSETSDVHQHVRTRLSTPYCSGKWLRYVFTRTVEDWVVVEPETTSEHGLMFAYYIHASSVYFIGISSNG